MDSGGPQQQTALTGEDQHDDRDPAARSRTWPDLPLNRQHLAWLELIAGGWLHPLGSYMGPREIQDQVLSGPLPPITLDVPESLGRALIGQTVALRDPEGVLLAGMSVVGAAERPRGADGSPVVALHGRLETVEMPIHYDHADLRLTRAMVEERIGDSPAWVVPAAGPLTVAARELITAAVGDGCAVVLLSLVGDAAPDDAATHTLVRAHRLHVARMQADLGMDRVVHAILPLPSPTTDPARHLLALVLGTLDMTPIVDADVAAVLVDRGRAPIIGPDGLVSRPAGPLDDDVAALITRRTPTPRTQGMTLFFTGLSGSGKSTVANAVMARLHAETDRRITMLDGDLVRQHLSSELSFSREHRDLNIMRIGFVAAEVAKHGGLAICAPIAPYAATRAAVADMVRANGAFVLVHVATPLAVCEARDRKGLYAKARAGEIPSFTGISDPYEAPTDADLVLDTSTGSVGDAAGAVMAMLRGRGFIEPDPTMGTA